MDRIAFIDAHVTRTGRVEPTDPAIVLADEPTGNLDSRSTDEVLEASRASTRRVATSITILP